MSDDTKIRAGLALASRKPCLLCDGPPDFAAAFVPDDDHGSEYGAPDGKDRWIFYSLCDACRERPDATEEIEQRLMSAVTEGSGDGD